MFAAESIAAESSGFEIDLINYETLVNDDKPVAAIRRVQPIATLETAIYRGWMLKPAVYSKLHQALLEKNIQLINPPEAYRLCHHFPESYPLIAAQTPRSAVIHLDSEFSIEKVMQALQPFADRPVILKDFVKSRKHEWHEACYIPSASDRSTVQRVTERFIELQGNEINEGLVFREFVEFEPLTVHSRSGMPLIREFRLFFLKNELLEATEYWEQGEYGDVRPPVGLFSDIAGKIASSFFTMDVARRKDGTWMIIELGDGQVAGLPDKTDQVNFYHQIYQRLVG
jgi:hypothetical protein